MSHMYSDGVVILDLEYLVAAHLTCQAGQWMIDVLLALGAEGQTLTLAYPSEAAGQAVLALMGHMLEEAP